MCNLCERAYGSYSNTTRFEGYIKVWETFDLFPSVFEPRRIPFFGNKLKNTVLYVVCNFDTTKSCAGQYACEMSCVFEKSGFQFGVVAFGTKNSTLAGVVV